MFKYRLFDLTGRVSVITGAASQLGLGFAMAKALGEAGSRLILTDIREQLLMESVAVLRNEGLDAHGIVADATSFRDAEAVRDFALDRFGRIDVLINNAGVGSMTPAESADFQRDWRRVMSTNLDGYFIMAQTIGKVMIEAGKGSIINLSSKSGQIVDTPNTQAAYNVSKSGVDMLTKSLAVEWAKYGVRVNAISPGNMVTQHTIDGTDDAFIPHWKSINPMGRFGNPEELGGAAIYLASDASSYTTGAVLLIDGGYCIV